MSNDDKQKRIDDYLLGKGDANTRREFEEESSRDADLSEQLGDTELAMAAIELAEDQALKARLQKLEASFKADTPAMAAESTAVIKQLPTPGTEKAGVRPRRNLRRIYAVAAAVLMLLMAGWFILQPKGYNSPNALAMATFEPYENITQGGVRGGEDDPARAAYAAYDAGRFAEAAALLGKLPTTATNKFYLGQSLLGSERYKDAAAQFEDLRKVDFGLAPESAYYLALARLGEGKTDQATALLTNIGEDAAHPMQEKAAALLTEISTLD